jgi:hypothetical protein
MHNLLHSPRIRHLPKHPAGPVVFNGASAILELDHLENLRESGFHGWKVDLSLVSLDYHYDFLFFFSRHPSIVRL